jgi:hypothetical protein
MTADKTDVDLLSLEDFKATLDARLSEANAVLTALTTTLAAGPSRTGEVTQAKVPALGTFADATQTANRYQQLYLQHLDRAARLVRAVTAAKTATSTILTNYRTAEERNRASASDISRVLSGVGTELNSEQTDA